MTDKQKLALRINEIFHDIEGEKYQEKHHDIFTGEAMRWQKIAEKYFQNYKNPITVLDIGTGTGFIPLNTAKFLSENDTFICSDISQEMLNVAKKNIANKNFKCNFKYKKLNGNSIDIDTATIITMNSVVHHIPDLGLFFTQIGKIIQPGGLIIIGHEPNKLFYTEKKLLNKYLFFQTFSSPKSFVKTVSRKLGITFVAKKLLKSKANNSYITKSINKILIKEGTIKKELSANEINKMIDYHSPSAGAKIDKTKGIDIEEIRKNYLPDFETEYFETYNFLSKMSNKNSFLKNINNSLSEKYIGKGATFFIVLNKKTTGNEN